LKNAEQCFKKFKNHKVFINLKIAMKKYLDRFKALTPTEMLLLGTVVVLVILIIVRWGWISDELVESFNNLFKKRS